MKTVEYVPTLRKLYIKLYDYMDFEGRILPTEMIKFPLDRIVSDSVKNIKEQIIEHKKNYLTLKY